MLLEPAAATEIGFGPCEGSGGRLDCHARTVLVAGPEVTRAVWVRLPLGVAPASGWPVVLAFQGSYFSPEHFFVDEPGLFDLFGSSTETEVAARLLAAGFAVLAPDAITHDLFWETNLPWIAHKWTGSSDDLFLSSLFDFIAKGAFGPLDASRLYAIGMSSGGYMASRMAVSYPGRFRALAIASASYATCFGIFCSAPDTLPADHPPTLFLHGLLDPVVPEWTMASYHRSLRDAGRESCKIVHTWAGHRWIPEAPLAVVRWFNQHP